MPLSLTQSPAPAATGDAAGAAQRRTLSNAGEASPLVLRKERVAESGPGGMGNHRELRVKKKKRKARGAKVEKRMYEELQNEAVLLVFIEYLRLFRSENLLFFLLAVDNFKGDPSPSSPMLAICTRLLAQLEMLRDDDAPLVDAITQRSVEKECNAEMFDAIRSKVGSRVLPYFDELLSSTGYDKSEPFRFRPVNKNCFSDDQQAVLALFLQRKDALRSRKSNKEDGAVPTSSRGNWRRFSCHAFNEATLRTSHEAQREEEEEASTRPTAHHLTSVSKAELRSTELAAAPNKRSLLQTKRALQHQLLSLFAARSKCFASPIAHPAKTMLEFMNARNLAEECELTRVQHLIMILSDPLLFSAFQLYVSSSFSIGSSHLNFWIAVEEWRNTSYEHMPYAAVQHNAGVLFSMWLCDREVELITNVSVLHEVRARLGSPSNVAGQGCDQFMFDEAQHLTLFKMAELFYEPFVRSRLYRVAIEFEEHLLCISRLDHVFSLTKFIESRVSVRSNRPPALQVRLSHVGLSHKQLIAQWLECTPAATQLITDTSASFFFDCREDNICTMSAGFNLEVPVRDAELSLVFLQFLNANLFYYGHLLFCRPHDNYFAVSEEGKPVVISVESEPLIGDDGKAVYRCLVRKPTEDVRILLQCDQSQRLKALKSHATLRTIRNIEKSKDSSLPSRLLSFERSVAEPTAYKFGVVYRKQGQTREDEMLSNQHGTLELEEFLSLLGEKIVLQGWNRYRGGLDASTNTTGTHAVFTSLHNDTFEVVFHVSTLLPWSSENQQQLPRKRHIGNDVVVVIFQDEGSGPFSPASFASHFNHVFVVVEPDTSSGETRYRVGVLFKDNVQLRPQPFLVNPPVYRRDALFRRWFLTKLINCERVALRSTAFSKRLDSTRLMLMNDIVTGK
eukprot:TRINITY_DN7552_c0_g1_i2.p1 TRINITY_DN7552_c0_g1~~TRINITY_DN7552_c0_g1_i2.p1  ORF type:complete len:996 (+),score=243.81 TRINITY_DN7552_c0_g1_i2:275-2989(+)